MKTIVCLCQDVTEDDIVRAIQLGYDNPETVKRFTAALMGPCQGRSCAEIVMAAVSRHTGIPIEELIAPPIRQPVVPVRMGKLAGGGPVDV
jgi:bacterioferritin-associated ferredoxin